MKVTITSNRLEPDTIRGEAFQVVCTYTSFDITEIDEIEENFKKQNNGSYAVVIEDTEDDLK